MNIQYNILIKPVFKDKLPLSIQKACIEATKDFLGEHYINQFGRVFDGLDKNCDTYYEAEFDFFNRNQPGTLDDAFEKAETQKLFLGGDEQIEFEENMNFFKKIKNFLETRDPTIFFYNSWHKYSSNAIPEPFKIKTPIGNQDSHVHLLPHLNPVQFYKPTQENQWYDYDILKRFVWEAMFARQDLWEEQRTTKNPIKKYVIIPQQRKKLQKIEVYHDKLLSLEPIKKININNNYQLPKK